MESVKVDGGGGDDDDIVGVPLKVTSSLSWPIFRGCLHGVVTCESSISTALEEHPPPPSTPLILRRPSPNSVPCEITILFTQLHQIKQIYVRSTARVYEIYYAIDDQGGNEYLCTVRCGVAVRDQEQPETDDGGSLSAASGVSNVIVDERHSTAESGSSTSYEDGWVDVKLHHSSKVDTGDASSSTIKDSRRVQDIQDRFEATAEISDADPVLSITIRLLSIQSGDYTYVDEVYVFADPVESIDDPLAPSLESSSGGALLSMFIPTLMQQLSRSRDSKVREHNGADAGERSIIQDNEQHSTAPALMSTNTLKADIMPSTMPSGPLHSECQSGLALQTPNLQNSSQLTYGEKDFPCSIIEQTLDKLVSRVSRIEGLCLRFEENMLKPVIMMEKRLERVEQQLESIIKSPQFPKTGYTKYSAPAFSCDDSESNSINAVGNDHPPAMMKFESREKDDDGGGELCIPASDAYSWANVQCHDVQSLVGDSKVLPGLLVTAPDFSFSDDEEEHDVVEDSLNVSSKRQVSIDDALASALAGFVSSALITPVRCTEMVEEAELVSVVEGSGGSPTSPSALSVSSTRPLECSELVAENFSAIEGSGNIVLSDSVQSDEHSYPSALAHTSKNSCTDFWITEKETPGAANYGATEADDVNDHVISEGGSKKPPGGSDSSSVDGLRKTNLNAGSGSTEPNGDEGVSDFCGSPRIDASSPSKDVFDAALEVPGVNVESSSREGVGSKCRVLLRDLIELPRPAIVDFSASVLDVKFSSLDNASAKPSLEALLVDRPNFGCTDPCVRVDNASSCSEADDFVRIEDDSSGVPETVNNQVLLFDYSKSPYSPSETEVQDGPNFSNQGMCPNLI